MRSFPSILIPAGLLIAGLAGLNGAVAQPVGAGGSTVAPAAATINNVGVQLSPDFGTTGNFKVQLRVTPAQGTADANFLNQFNDSINYMNCAISQPTPLCCSCDERTVTAGSGGSALDVAIDIDSSGSNDPGAVADPSDPDDLRLVAAQQVVDALLTGSNRVAAFNFGTRYCVVGAGCTDQDDPGGFYRGLQMLGSVTYRFSNGYVDATQKDVVKANLAKAGWASNNGTPIYTSLYDIIDNMDTSLGRTSTRVIVVFSDGEPMNDGRDQSDVCDAAVAKAVKILAVGYGPGNIKNENKSVRAVEVLQALASCSGGVYMAIEDIGEIGAKAQSLAQALTEGHLDLSCHLSDPTQILMAENMEGSVVDGTATLHLNNGSVGGPVTFSFIPPVDSMIPEALPGQDPATVGPTCPQPQTGQPIIDERPPLPPLPCPEGTADFDGDGDCEGMGALPPDIQVTNCLPGAENFPDCLVIDAQDAGECAAAGGHWVAGEGVVIPAHLYAEMQKKGHGIMTLPDGTVVKYMTIPSGLTVWQTLGRCLSEAGAASLSAGGDEDGGDSGNCSLTPGSPRNALPALLLIIPATALWWLRRRRALRESFWTGK